MGRCQAQTKKGKGGTNCRRKTQPGQRYCRMHAGGRRAGRRGGNGCALLVLAALVSIAAMAGLFL
jgi:hypothetical protein